MSDLTFKELAAIAFAQVGNPVPECIAKADQLAEEFCAKHGHTGQENAHFVTAGRNRSAVAAKPCSRCGEALKDTYAHMPTAPRSA